MSPNPFRTAAFQRLFQEWNRKLAESGFKDAEDFSLPEPALRNWDSLRFQKPTAVANDERETYYALATRLLHNGFVFHSDVSRRVWELHCQGQSVRQIEAVLRSQLMGYRSTRRDCVHRWVVEVQRRSGIKKR